MIICNDIGEEQYDSDFALSAKIISTENDRAKRENMWSFCVLGVLLAHCW